MQDLPLLVGTHRAIRRAKIVLLRRFALIAKGRSIAFSVAAPSAARPGQAGIWGRSMTRICQKELMPTMKIEALTERYQTRRKTALNRVLVEPEKFATRRREHFRKSGVRGTAASAPHSRLLATTLIVALGRRIRRPAPIQRV